MTEDRSWKATIAFGICIAFAAGALFTSVVLPYTPTPPSPSLGLNIYGLPLSEVWTIVKDQTGIENATAVLEEFRLVTAANGSVESLIFTFQGDNEDIHRWYQVAVSPTGAITWDSRAVDGALAGEHPLILFSEIERIPYRELTGEGTGLIIDVDAQYGDLAYGAGYKPLFALHQGEALPLESVAFSTDEPWYDIAIFVRTSGSPTGEESIPEEDSHCCTLFASRDLDKAERVGYRDPLIQEVVRGHEPSQPVYTDPPNASLNEQDPVTIILGGLPSSEGGQNASYSDLETFKAATWNLIQERYLYPNGSVIGFGYDADGYLRVSLWNGPPSPENVTSIEAVFAILDERAKDMGIENIPVKFTVFTSPPDVILATG